MGHDSVAHGEQKEIEWSSEPAWYLDKTFQLQSGGRLHPADS